MSINGRYLDTAIRVAAAAHSLQVDKNGEPFILHPLRVMTAALEKSPKDYTLACVAVLHDVLEDYDFLQLDDMRTKFGHEVANALEFLTRKKGQLTYEGYIIRLSMDPLAVTVKILDLTDNLRPGCTPKRRLRYESAIKFLRGIRAGHNV